MAESRVLMFGGDIPLTVTIPSHSYTGQGGQESEDYESEEQLQHRILTAALEFVPEHGWTAEAIAEGAKVCGERSNKPVENWMELKCRDSQACMLPPHTLGRCTLVSKCYWAGMKPSCYRITPLELD